MRLSRELPHRQIFLFIAHTAGASFQALPIFRLRVPNFYCLRGMAPPVFELAYYRRTSFCMRPHLHFCGTFCHLLRRGSVFFVASFAANLPPRACQFGHESPVCQTAIFPPACCISIWRVPCQHSCWFKSFRYVVLAVPVLVGWFEDFFVDRRHIVQSNRFHISCTVVGSFFFFVGVPVRSIAG